VLSRAEHASPGGCGRGPLQRHPGQPWPPSAASGACLRHVSDPSPPPMQRPPKLPRTLTLYVQYGTEPSQLRRALPSVEHDMT
jgi:hypothetical protein